MVNPDYVEFIDYQKENVNKQEQSILVEHIKK